MQELYDTIKNVMENFEGNAARRLAGNKAAGVRSRKYSFVLEKLLKEWRKASVKGE